MKDEDRKKLLKEGITIIPIEAWIICERKVKEEDGYKNYGIWIDPITIRDTDIELDINNKSRIVKIIPAKQNEYVLNLQDVKEWYYLDGIVSEYRGDGIWDTVDIFTDSDELKEAKANMDE